MHDVYIRECKRIRGCDKISHIPQRASEELLALQPLTINGENTFTMVIKGDKMMMNDDRKGTLSILSDGIMTEYCRKTTPVTAALGLIRQVRR